MTDAAFVDFSWSDFPFRLDYLTEDDDRLVWSRVIPGPGALEVPALAVHYGTVYARLTFADGRVVTSRDDQPDVETWEGECWDTPDEGGDT